MFCWSLGVDCLVLCLLLFIAYLWLFCLMLLLLIVFVVCCLLFGGRVRSCSWLLVAGCWLVVVRCWLLVVGSLLLLVLFSDSC